MIVIAQSYDTVDAICWRYYKQTVGMVEKVYEMNPGLSQQSVFLAEGTKINLPLLESHTKVKAGVKLW